MFLDLIALSEADGDGFDWKSVSTNHPEVKEAAKHAVKWIQEKSNSLFPYKLIDIILARTKVCFFFFFLSYVHYQFFFLIN